MPPAIPRHVRIGLLRKGDYLYRLTVGPDCRLRKRTTDPECQPALGSAATRVGSLPLLATNNDWRDPQWPPELFWRRVSTAD
jgi:hypothetical protein